MTEATSKIRIKIGTMEIDYEGDPSFLEGGIEKLLETMGELAGGVAAQSPEPDSKAAQVSVQTTPTSNSNSTFQFTTSTLAAHTDAKTGPELTLCAIATLQLVKGQSNSARGEILDEMKTAGAYYNSNIGSNHSKALNSLARNKRINEVATGKYALSSTELKRFEAAVAEIS